MSNKFSLGDSVASDMKSFIESDKCKQIFAKPEVIAKKKDDEEDEKKDKKEEKEDKKKKEKKSSNTVDVLKQAMNDVFQISEILESANLEKSAALMTVALNSIVAEVEEMAKAGTLKYKMAGHCNCEGCDGNCADNGCACMSSEDYAHAKDKDEDEDEKDEEDEKKEEEDEKDDENDDRDIYDPYEQMMGNVPMVSQHEQAAPQAQSPTHTEQVGVQHPGSVPGTLLSREERARALRGGERGQVFPQSEHEPVAPSMRRQQSAKPNLTKKADLAGKEGDPLAGELGQGKAVQKSFEQLQKERSEYGGGAAKPQTGDVSGMSQEQLQQALKRRPSHYTKGPSGSEATPKAPAAPSRPAERRRTPSNRSPGGSMVVQQADSGEASDGGSGKVSNEVKPYPTDDTYANSTIDPNKPIPERSASIISEWFKKMAQLDLDSELGDDDEDIIGIHTEKPEGHDLPELNLEDLEKELGFEDEDEDTEDDEIGLEEVASVQEYIEKLARRKSKKDKEKEEKEKAKAKEKKEKEKAKAKAKKEKEDARKKALKKK